MAWRFKASKYKNAAPLEPKLDTHIRDLAIGSYHSCGNFIGASGAFVAFNWDMLGSSLGHTSLSLGGLGDLGLGPDSHGLGHAHHEHLHPHHPCLLEITAAAEN